MQDANNNSGLHTVIKQEAVDPSLNNHNFPDSGMSSSSPIPTNPNNTSSSSNSSLPDNFSNNFSFNPSPNTNTTGLQMNMSLPPLNLPPPPPPPIPSFNYNNTSLFNQHFRNQVGQPYPSHHNMFGLFKNNGQVRIQNKKNKL